MKSVTHICSAILVGMGGVVLLGWVLKIEMLKRVLPGLVAMNPATVMAFIFSGVSLGLCGAETVSPSTKRRAALVLAWLVAGLGFLKCGSYLFGWKIAVDQILFSSELPDAQTGIANRMAPNTAFNFLLSGMALVLMDRKTRSRWHPTDVLALLVGLLSLLAVIGYLLNSISFYRVTTYIPMALHTAVVFLVLVAGLISARTDHGLARLLCSRSSGGTTMRRLLPAAIIIPLLLALLRSLGEQAGFYDVSFGISLMVAITIAVFASLIFSNAVALEKADEARRQAEEKIQQLNAELKQHANQLEEVNKELEAFSYSVSHDLRAPLRAVDGFSNILLKKYSTEIPADARRLVNTIITNARQMGMLIDDLLRLSQLGRQSLSKRPVKILFMVEGLIRDLRREHQGREIVIHLQELPDAVADAALLKQVLVNLLSNAFKFTRQKEKAEIEIGCRREAGEKIYFIRDNGAGFDMAYVKKLFGVFQRLHSVEQFEGTGVGLSIVQRIIQRHGGRIWAESIVGQGATFYFSLPD